MAQAHHLPRLDDRDPQQTRLQDRFSLPHNLSKAGTVVIQAISNRAFTVAKLVASTLVSVELVVIKQLDKVTKPANMEATKHSEATTMAIANNVADGVATTDTKGHEKWLHVLG